MTVFAKDLLDSNLAADAVGPKIGSPASTKTSAIPSAKGTSGPTIVKSISLAKAKFFSASMSVSEISTLVPIDLVPAFPGAMKSFYSLGL